MSYDDGGKARSFVEENREITAVIRFLCLIAAVSYWQECLLYTDEALREGVQNGWENMAG